MQILDKCILIRVYSHIPKSIASYLISVYDTDFNSIATKEKPYTHAYVLPAPPQKQKTHTYPLKLHNTNITVNLARKNRSFSGDICN
ncbi:putative PEBP-like superfamily protein [Helianthus anomalus]